MGNAFSEEEEGTSEGFLEDGFDLDSPDADGKINFGTAAPNCQPRHTRETSLKKIQSASVPDHEEKRDVGQEVAMTEDLDNEDQQEEGGSGGRTHAAKHRRDSSSANSAGSNGNGSDSAAGGGGEHRGKRQHLSQSQREQQQQERNPKKMSYIQMAKMGYQELINAIIRPPRADYKMEALGPPAFNFCGKRFTRTDFTLRTKRGFNLECSHWEPVERATDRIPVVIYMHGNSSARVEVIPQLSYLLSLGLAVFAFDFAGSGKSDGEYVSLGYYEREDLSCIVAHLRATNVVSTIALWGRSMGAATALMFGDRDPSIACMVLDSPFADLTQLCEEMVEKGREQGIIVPNLVVSVAIRMLQGSVKKQAGFNIKSISPITHVDKCFIPALFVAGEHDDFIRKHHSEELYEKYAGDKNLIIVEGDHNSPRPKFMFDSASIFLQTCLQIPGNWALPVPVSMNLMCPPWFFEMYQQRASQRRNANASAAAHNRPSASSAASTAATANGTTATASSGASASGSVMNGSADAVQKSANAAGFDHDEMGMTAERQRVIQASLFKMLGQADGIEGENDNKESSAPVSRNTGSNGNN